MNDPETPNSSWKGLFRAGGVAALIIAAFTIIQIIVFLTNPPPTTAEGWFTLFQTHKLIGLVNMDLLLVADNVLAIPVLLALYMILRQDKKSTITIAVTLGFIGIATYFASNTAFQMLSLSNKYAAASTETQRAMYLAAGQGMLAIYQGTAFYVGNFLGTIALLIISVVMVQSKVFNKATGYVGIAANVLGLGLFVPTTIGLAASVVSVVFLMVWWLLIARTFFRLR